MVYTILYQISFFWKWLVIHTLVGQYHFHVLIQLLAVTFTLWTNVSSNIFEKNLNCSKPNKSYWFKFCFSLSWSRLHPDTLRVGLITLQHYSPWVTTCISVIATQSRWVLFFLCKIMEESLILPLTQTSSHQEILIAWVSNYVWALTPYNTATATNPVWSTTLIDSIILLPVLKETEGSCEAASSGQF